MKNHDAETLSDIQYEPSTMKTNNILIRHDSHYSSCSFLISLYTACLNQFHHVYYVDGRDIPDSIKQSNFSERILMLEFETHTEKEKLWRIRSVWSPASRLLIFDVVRIIA
jgi:hypothetical protein